MHFWDIEKEICVHKNIISRNLVTAMSSSSEHPNLVFQSGEDLVIRAWDVRTAEVAFNFPQRDYFGVGIVSL